MQEVDVADDDVAPKKYDQAACSEQWSDSIGREDSTEEQRLLARGSNTRRYKLIKSRYITR